MKQSTRIILFSLGLGASASGLLPAGEPAAPPAPTLAPDGTAAPPPAAAAKKKKRPRKKKKTPAPDPAGTEGGSAAGSAPAPSK